VGIVSDPSVLIAWERKRLDLETQLVQRVEEDSAISAMTASELLHGVHRAVTPAQRSQRKAFVEGFRGITTSNPCLFV
jgi:tRNA(fMet)-specific endonuclease VapC